MLTAECLSPPGCCANLPRNGSHKSLVRIESVILPYVREVLADVEKSTGFQQAAAYLKQRRGEASTSAGRIRLSGLVPTAKALLIPLLQRTASAPLIVIVSDNRAAEALFPVVQAFCEL